MGKFTAPNAKILAVDDVSTNLVVISGILEEYGCQIDTCSSGTEAIKMVQQNNYDIVFMDHMMPDMDGIESARHIRALKDKRYTQLPIIALTANAMAGMKELFIDQGFTDYLSKPIEIKKVDEIMIRWVSADKIITKTEEKPDAKNKETIFDGITIKNLDLAQGKEYYNETKYLEVLRSYTVHTPALLKALRETTSNPLSGETINNFTITAHGIKGASYGICANTIAIQAEDLEHAARSGNLKYVTEKAPNLIKETEILLRDIINLLEKISNKTPKPLAASPDSSLLAQLLDACKQYKAGSMEIIMSKLESFKYESGGDLIAWLRQQADNLEYDAMVERLKKTQTASSNV